MIEELAAVARRRAGRWPMTSTWFVLHSRCRTGRPTRCTMMPGVVRYAKAISKRLPAWGGRRHGTRRARGPCTRLPAFSACWPSTMPSPVEPGAAVERDGPPYCGIVLLDHVLVGRRSRPRPGRTALERWRSRLPPPLHLGDAGQLTLAVVVYGECRSPSRRR